MKDHFINPKKQKWIRKLLRNHPTPWEHKLWQHLKGRQLGGFKFRRQQGINANVVDFFCPKLKLIVELDGAGHLSPATKKKDINREDELTDLGYHIIRFYNNEIDENLDGVLTIIENECIRLSD